MPRPRFHRLTIADVRRETSECVSASFLVPNALAAAYRYRPGQYLTLRTMVDQEEVRRSYSICAGLDDNELRVAIKRLDGGLFSTWAQENLHVGETLDVMTPDGRFGVPPEPGANRTLVAFAAGSGITPILSIMKTTLRRERGQFVLFYGNRNTGSIIFREQLEDLKDRFMARLAVFHVMSREKQDVPALNGRLDAEKASALLRMMVPVDDIAHAFICGPQPMIEGLEKALLDIGLSRPQVHVERFTPAAGAHLPVIRAPATSPAAAIATVIFEGIRSEFPVAEGETIIDAGLRAGLNLPYSCKGGMCCTCRARVLEGRVEMVVNYSLEPWETEVGFVLTCQAIPVTSRVTIDYDSI